MLCVAVSLSASTSLDLSCATSLDLSCAVYSCTVTGGGMRVDAAANDSVTAPSTEISVRCVASQHT